MFRSVFLSAALAAPALADAPQLAFPLDCDLGADCFIQQYVDRDPGPGATDFACGTLSYDGHKGTDFALPDLKAMAAGVDVLAAAPGRVLGIRDGMADVLQGTPGAPSVDGRECGNGILVDIGDDWTVQYCHMRQDSLRVSTGDIVQTGDVLGQLGLSGNTQFPHLHLSVRRGGVVIDPFDIETTVCGSAAPISMWAKPIETPPGGMIAIGFLDAVPSYTAIREGEAQLPDGAVAAELPALVLWADMFGVRDGDALMLEIVGPAGVVLNETVQLDRTQAQAFRAVGRRTPSEGWSAGDYTGLATLLRDGTVLATRQIRLDLH